LPSIKYNQEYNSDYDVTKLTGPQPAGKASIEAFFTKKGNAVYAMLTRWHGKTFVLKDAATLTPTRVSLLGGTGTLAFSKRGDTIEVTLPDLPEALLGQPMWTLKIE